VTQKGSTGKEHLSE